MICVSIGHCNPDKAEKLAAEHELVEFRMDTIADVKHHVPMLFRNRRAIATCRPEYGPERTQLLFSAMDAGAAYVDLELETDSSWRETCIKKARNSGTSVILSYHDMKQTPSDDELNNWMKRGRDNGADVVKLACYCNSNHDCARLLQLASRDGANTVILGMGPYGVPTRILGPLFGSPFTFAAPDGHGGTAPGQIPFNELRTLIQLIRNRMHDH